MTETLQLKGTLIGHSGWVTQIATNPKYPDMILSSSRGKIFFLTFDCNLFDITSEEASNIKSFLPNF